MHLRLDIIERLKNADQSALFELMQTNYNELYRYALKYTADKELAKDIVSQFFIHFWEKRTLLAKAENVQAYIMVSFRNHTIHYLQKIQRQLDLPIQDFPGFEYSYEEYLIACQQQTHLRQLLQEAIESLSPRQRQLLQLRYYDCLSYEQISSRTNLTQRTVYNKIHEAIKALRSHNILQFIRKKIG
jgi:RNA polymerase sigma-70 factor (ECF subfamily)